MNNAIAIKKLNETELNLGIAGTSASWHHEHENNPTIYIGGLPKTHMETHILSIFEQYGTITHVNLVKDSVTKESKQFAFVMYVDARSAILAVDNLNAIEIDGSILRVDHVTDYRMPQPPAAFDTTPIPEEVLEDPLSAHMKTARRKENTAEKLREVSVMHRLGKLRKKRRVHVTNSPDIPQSNPASAHDSTGSRSHANSTRRTTASDDIIADRDENDSAPLSPIREIDEGTQPTRELEEATRDERRQSRIEKERRRAYRASVRQARTERRSQRHQKLQER